MELRKKSGFLQKVAFALAFLMVNQIMFPTLTYALTSGPTQPEVQGFEPVGTTQMVDLFSGDFNYNLPLFDLPGPDGGYPFNLAYHAGATMDQEASWVGLGWSLNPGVIKRSMRGLPDEFNGDKIKVDQDMRTNHTVSLGANLDAGELFGYEMLDNFTIGPNITYNTYKGVSMGLDIGYNFGLPKGFSGNAGLSFKQGDGVGLSLGVSRDMNGIRGGLNAKFKSGVGITGFGYSIKISEADKPNTDTPDEGEEPSKKKYELLKSEDKTASDNFTFSGQSFMSDISMPLTTGNVSGNFSFGPDLGGYDPEMSFNLSYSWQKVSDRNQTLAAYGYLHLDESTNEEDMMDFNREKDGTVYKNTPNLGSPVLTHDIYSVVGQGIGTLYRPKRSDIGILGNRRSVNTGGGGGFGIELHTSGITNKVGADIDVNYSRSVSEKWTPNANVSEIDFKNEAEASLADYEKYYFQAANEMTAEPIGNFDKIGGVDPVRFKLKNRNNGESGLQLADNAALEKRENGTELDIINNDMFRTERKARQSSILPITNKDLLNGDEEILGEYDIQFYEKDDINDYLNANPVDLSQDGNEYARNSNYGSHFAGFTALQPDGLRYVYGLPIYNALQEDYVFSVDGTAAACGPDISIPVSNGEVDYDVSGTDKYYKKTALPPFVHSNMLTSVLGADYIDADNIPGPSNGDYGYWVKFNYVKATEDGNSGKYKWRSPFFDANYVQGIRNQHQDDKANFVYGEREQYYVATVETKTHIAEFEILERDDALGASSKFQDASSFDANQAAKSYQLDKINIYSKIERQEQGSNAIPIKTVHFKYKDRSNSLCYGVHNSGTTTGKLTLEKVYFTYGNNNRGELSPYTFDYNQDDNSQNPDYNLRQYDKWGMYKPNNGSSNAVCDNQYMPYVQQFDNNNPSFKDDMDRNASVWNLKSIRLPSGAYIGIDYEIDDYAYEQNRVATEMHRVNMVGGSSAANIIAKGDVSNDAQKRRVYFETDNDVPLSSDEDVKKYIEDLHIDELGERQVYFKVMINLKNTTADVKEFVEGYAKIEDYGYSPTNGAYVVLKGVDLDKGNQRFHPFSAAAWQHLRVALPNKIYTNSGLSEPGDDFGKDEIKSFAGNLGAVLNVFSSYYTYCKNSDFGLELDLSRSFIKLNNPKKQKLGGGLRVKKITIDDNWEDIDGEGNTVGQVFEYTTTDEEGNKISSGVLTKEPTSGGEESALRFAKIYPDGTLLRTENNFFFEGPINESYFPAASVGYSKVVVKSLATDYAMNPGNIPSGMTLPKGFATTGVAVNEFYTAKDYPVITNETDLDSRSRNIIMPIPFMSYSDERYTGTQGYSIELNDMHGKPKATKYFALDESNAVIEQPISETIYTYFDKEASYGKRAIRKLVNTVSVLLSDDGASGVNEQTQQVGVDYEFFTDMRRTMSLQTSAGFGPNTNILGIFPALTFFPRGSYANNVLKTAVTNKIIRRRGIVKKVTVSDESSKIVTENKSFDPLTGEALLTTVTNIYDDLVYNYSIPAHWKYDGMGAAYKNIGMRYQANSITSAPDPLGGHKINGISTMFGGAVNVDNYLVEGDEFVVMENNAPKGTAIFLGKRGADYFFDIENTPIITNGLELYLVRSGNRNHLNAKTATIKANSNPLYNRSIISLSGNVDVPTNVNGSQNANTVNHDSYRYNNSMVLDANVITYKDAWGIADGESCNSNTVNSAYANGEKGIWRPYKSYAYLTPLKAGNDPDHVKLREDGVYQDFVMYDWNNPFFDQLDGHDWKQVNESTLFNKDGKELESRDALGHYSTALYGYNDYLSTAVALNSRYRELAFDGFEEYKTGTLSSITSGSTNSHLDIVSPCTTNSNFKATETHSIISGIKRTGVDIYAIVNKEYYAGIATPMNATLNLMDEDGKSYTVNLNVTGTGSKILTDDYKAYYDKPEMLVLKLNDINNALPNNKLLTGQATLHYNYNVAANGQGNTKISVTNRRAHTGSKALYIPGGFAPSFAQNTMHLEKGKKYVFSAWVSEENEKKPKFDAATVLINGSTTLKASGRVIDGWQRIEGEFIAGSTTNLTFKMQNGIVEEGLYIDDIRIYPANASMQSYVYSPLNYRLLATLDANNFATFYSYDSAGNLVVVRKETKEGIMTMKEARSHTITSN